MILTNINDLPSSILVTNTDCEIIEFNENWSNNFLAFDPNINGRMSLYDFTPPPSRIFLQTHVIPTILKESSISEIYLNLLDKNEEPIPVLFNAQRRQEKDNDRIIWSIFISKERRKLEIELQRRKQHAEDVDHTAKRLFQTFYRNLFNNKDRLSQRQTTLSSTRVPPKKQEKVKEQIALEMKQCEERILNIIRENESIVPEGTHPEIGMFHFQFEDNE